MELTGLQVYKVDRLTMSIYGVDMSHISLFSPHCLYLLALNHQDKKKENILNVTVRVNRVIFYINKLSASI